MMLQNKVYLLIVFILIIIPYSNSQSYYKKIIHNTDPEAKCLDGSPGALYMHEGSEKDKFLIFFIGGGFCGEETLADTLESCFKRSKDMFGSSTLWPDVIDQHSGVQGILSTNQSLYKDWNKILFAYCDGAFHQGDNQNPIQYKGVQLFFRGARITRSHFKWLNQKYSLFKASKILFSGGSAGALSTFLWGNYFLDQVQNKDSVYIVPDSGIFLETPTFKENKPLISLQIQNLMRLAQMNQKSPIKQCNLAYPGQQWKCLFIYEASPFLRGRYLFINSEYDTWTVQYLLKMNCMVLNSQGGASFANCSRQEMDYIESYRSRYLQFINKKIKTNNRGIWSISCGNHVYSTKNNFYDVNQDRVPVRVGITAKEAIQNFVISNKIEWNFDTEPWPLNDMCAL